MKKLNDFDAQSNLIAEMRDVQEAIINNHSAEYYVPEGISVGVLNKKNYYHPGIYFVLCPMTNLMKIGRSVCIYRRIIDLINQNGAGITILMAIHSDISITEQSLHRYFKFFSHHGEWFRYEGYLKSFVELFAQGMELHERRKNGLYALSCLKQEELNDEW